MFSAMKIYEIKKILLLLAVATIALVTLASAQDKTPVCATRNLDVRVLPEFIDDFIHIVPIEFSNMGAESCGIPPELEVALTPTQTESIGDYDGATPPSFIRPGGTIHTLLVWSPKPREGALCPTYDGFALRRSSGSSIVPPILTVRHLTVRTCQLFSTSFRDGVYVPGEHVPAVWFDARPNAKPLGIAAGITLAGPDEAVRLEAPTPQPVLGDRVNLLLHLPASPLPACPYAVLRARRTNGETFVFFDHCDANDPAPPPEGLLVALRPLDLLETTGEIRFDVITQTTPTSYAQSAPVTIHMRTRKAPALPLIADDNPVCTSDELTLQPAVAPLDDGDRVAEAFTFRNTSSHTCRIGGVPRIETLNRVTGKDGKRRAEPWPASLCPNCDDPLFTARPNVWTDIAPGDSAHFLVGHTLGDHLGTTAPWAIGAQYGAAYTVAVGMQWTDGPRAVQLGVRGVIGEPLDVSAWRAGPFDHDPRNAHWHPPVAASTPAIKCESAAGDAPPANAVFFPDDGGKSLRYGLAVENPTFHLGDELLAHIWVANTTDRLQYVDTCNPKFPEIVVFDTEGHHVVDPNGKPEPAPFSCLRSMNIVTIAAHSCVLLDAKERLGSETMLTPGDYIVTTAGHQPSGSPATVPGAAFRILNEAKERTADYEQEE